MPSIEMENPKWSVVGIFFLRGGGLVRGFEISMFVWAGVVGEANLTFG